MSNRAHTVRYPLGGDIFRAKNLRRKPAKKCRRNSSALRLFVMIPAQCNKIIVVKPLVVVNRERHDVMNRQIMRADNSRARA